MLRRDPIVNKKNITRGFLLLLLLGVVLAGTRYYYKDQILNIINPKNNTIQDKTPKKPEAEPEAEPEKPEAKPEEHTFKFDCTGNGSFPIDLYERQVFNIGSTIPEGSQNLRIKLNAGEKDIELSIRDTKNNINIICYADQHGRYCDDSNIGTKRMGGSTKYKNIAYSYSGHLNTSKPYARGIEEISIDGVTNVPLQIFVYATDSGTGTISYSYTPPADCNTK